MQVPVIAREAKQSELKN